MPVESMKYLLMGYSGYARIDGFDTLMTSFSLQMSENVIQSGGASKIFNDEMFNRFKLNAVRDYPGYDISITCDVTKNFLLYFLSNLQTGFRRFIQVEFFDNASGLYYLFDKCCLTSIQLSVDNNSATTLSFGFVTYKDEIEIEEGDVDYQAIRLPAPELVGDSLLPYWAWGVDYTDFLNNSPFSFNISYTQAVTPKYGCFGEKSRNAVCPKKIIFGVPEVKYELTYILDGTITTHDFEIDSDKIAHPDFGKTLVVKYHQEFPSPTMSGGDDGGDDGDDETSLNSADNDGDDGGDGGDDGGDGLSSDSSGSEGTVREPIHFKLTFSHCYPDEYSPQYANAGDVNRISISGTVYGGISFVEGLEADEIDGVDEGVDDGNGDDGGDNDDDEQYAS